MKKIFTTLVLTIALVATVAPMAVSAQGAATECSMADLAINPTRYTGLSCTTPCVFSATPDCGMCCLLSTLYNITDWIFVIFVFVAVLFVLLGAYQIITAGGTAEKVSTGRQYLMYAAIGLAVAFLSRAVPAIVKMLTS